MGKLRVNPTKNPEITDMILFSQRFLWVYITAFGGSIWLFIAILDLYGVPCLNPEFVTEEVAIMSFSEDALAQQRPYFILEPERLEIASS